MFSRRTAWDLTPNELVVARQHASFAGEWIDLTSSNPTTVQLAYPQDTMTRALAQPAALVYEPACTGLASTRRFVADTYRQQGVDVEVDDLVLTASSSEAYSFLLKLLCDPGDSILVPQPSYPLFDDLARLESVRVRGYPLRAQDGWRTDVQALSEAVDDSVRAVFIVSPNNPTGSYLVRDELDAIEELAQRRGLALVSDEVFADYIWRDDPARVRCAAKESRTLAFSLGGLSKSACLPQMKLGWIVAGGPEPQRRAAMARLEMIGDTFLSVGTPIQHAAPALFEAAAGVREQLRHRIRRNLEMLQGVFDATSPVTVMPVRAGWYAVLRLPAFFTGEQWASLLARTSGVLTHPGEFFGFAEPACLVVSLIVPEAAFETGVRRIAGSAARASEA